MTVNLAGLIPAAIGQIGDIYTRTCRLFPMRLQLRAALLSTIGVCISC